MYGILGTAIGVHARIIRRRRHAGDDHATRLEETVWAAVERVLRNPVFIVTEVERRQQGVHAEQNDLERERSLFAGQITQCDKELRKWEQAYIADVIDVHDLKARKAEVMARRVSLKRELARLDEQQQLLEQVTLEIASLVEYCQRVYRSLQRLDYAEKRLALDALDITVIWHHNKTFEVHGSIPVSIASDAPCCTPRQEPADAVDVDKHGLRLDVALVDALRHVGILEMRSASAKPRSRSPFAKKVRW